MNEAGRLATLRDYGLLDTPAEAQFDAIVDEAAALAGAPIATITLVDENRQWFKARLGIEDAEAPLDISFCAAAIASGERTFVVPDARADERFRDFSNVTGGAGVRFYAGVPLTMENGARLGTLCVLDIVPREGLDEAERRALEALARRTVAAFELRRDTLTDGTALAALDAAAMRDVWLERAGRLMGQASAALFHAGADAPIAHLEHVIASVDALRGEAGVQEAQIAA